MIYNVKDRPPFNKLLMFAFQMVMSVFVATALIATICSVLPITPLVSAGLMGAGFATLMYILITKGESPMFMSNSGAFVTPVIVALTIGGYGAVAIGGITTALVYCIFGLLFTRISVDKVYSIFPEALIGAVTAVIGINLMTFIPTYVQINGVTNMWGVSVALITMISIAIISHYAKGVVKTLPFLLGTLIGYVYAIILTITKTFEIVDFSVFENLTLFIKPDFAFMHWEPVSWSTVTTVIILYIAYTISAMMECLSDHAALGGIIEKDLYKTPGLSRIFIGEGMANIVGTFIGGLGICSYGESVACIGFSKVASVAVTAVAALMLILLGILAPVQAFIASIPSCVFAGAAMILYGYIACSGIKMLQKVDLNKQKNLIITSVVLSLGICGIAVGGETLSFSGTALALIVGIILNVVLKDDVTSITRNNDAIEAFLKEDYKQNAVISKVDTSDAEEFLIQQYIADGVAIPDNEE